MAEEFKWPLVFVVGPTGVGKSQLALEVAKEIQAAILNCDSVQCYKDLDVGTAKPTAHEREIVKHFMFDIRQPGEILTAGDYRKEAITILDHELKNRAVLAVGGSGFYIQALEKGMFEIEKLDEQKESEIRAQLDKKTLKELYQELASLDPETADDLNPNDSYRIYRALVIIRGFNQKLSDLKKKFRPQPLPYKIHKMGLRMERSVLRERIKARTQMMIANGFIDEVKGLLERGLRPWPIMQSVGYKQVVAYLEGELKESDLVEEITLRTSQLAKRQMTWFQRDQEIRWFEDSELAKRWLISLTT